MKKTQLLDLFKKGEFKMKDVLRQWVPKKDTSQHLLDQLARLTQQKNKRSLRFQHQFQLFIKGQLSSKELVSFVNSVRELEGIHTKCDTHFKEALASGMINQSYYQDMHKKPWIQTIKPMIAQVNKRLDDSPYLQSLQKQPSSTDSVTHQKKMEALYLLIVFSNAVSLIGFSIWVVVGDIL